MIYELSADVERGFNVRAIIRAPKNGLRVYSVSVEGTGSPFRVSVVSTHKEPPILMRRLNGYLYGDTSRNWCEGLSIMGNAQARIPSGDKFNLDLRDRGIDECYYMYPYVSLGVSVNFEREGRATVRFDLDALCDNCGDTESSHANNKCLFAPTNWKSP